MAPRVPRGLVGRRGVAGRQRHGDLDCEPTKRRLAPFVTANHPFVSASGVWSAIDTRLAQDEVEWWANHADAVPPELTRKERDVMRRRYVADLLGIAWTEDMPELSRDADV